MKGTTSSTSSEPLILQVQPARAESTRDLVGLETVMQSLALSPRSPIALEIAATTIPTASRSFLLRAKTPVALRHLATQMQSRYPQARISAVSADPLRLAPLEECSVVELSPGAASYLPMRGFRAQELRNEGVDPLLGILAACNHVPPQARAVAQLALLPASPTWSRAHHQAAAQSMLDQEQRRHRGQRETVTPGLGKIFALFLLVVLLVLVSRFQKILFPSWLLQAGATLVRGKTPTLSPAHTILLVGIGIALLTLLFGGAVLFSRLSARFAQPLYDQRLVAEKTARPAYRTRLRLFVITPGEAKPNLAGQPATWKQVATIWFRSLRTSVSVLRRHGKRVLAFLRQSMARWFYRIVHTILSPRRSFTLLLLRVRALPARAWRFLTHPRACLSSFVRTNPTIQRGKRWVIAVRTDLQEAWKAWGEWREAMHRYRTHARERAALRRDLLDMLVAAYAQYHLASGGFFSPRKLRKRQGDRLLTTEHTWALFRTRGWSADLRRSSHYLSVADLAALWHLPQAQDLANLAHLPWSTERTLLAPPIVTTGQGYSLGSSIHAGQKAPVFLPWSCLRQNMLACASTGKGKSSWLLHLARALFYARTSGELRGGLLLIDVHGDLHRHALESLPSELEEEVVVIDLAEPSRMIGLNPLDVSCGADLDKLVDNIIVIIEAIWSHSYGPRTENILEYACKTLVAANRTIVARDPLHGPDQQYTLLDVVPLIGEESFRHALLEQVSDPFIHNWWAHYFERLDAHQQKEFSSSVMTKFSKFASSRVARRILGQPRSTMHLAEMIAQEQIILLNCASGEVGADLAAFIGAVLLGLFHVTLAEQARLDEHARKRFLVLVDEFQALKGVDYQTMLAELRKYGGSFALATQSLAYLDRLDRSLRATVLANIDHLFAFAMSAEDAELLRLEGVEPEDLVNLPNYTCYARLLLNGERLPLFSLRLDNPLPALSSEEEDQRAERRHRVSSRSHVRYARPVGEIDELLLSIQTREALMMQPAKKKETQTGEAAVSPRDTEKRTGTQRGTKRRGSGKGGTERTRSATEKEAAQTHQDTPVIHTLFAAAEAREEREPGNQEENHAQDHCS